MVYIDDQLSSLGDSSVDDDFSSPIRAETLDNSNTTSLMFNRPTLSLIIISNSFKSNGVSSASSLEETFSYESYCAFFDENVGNPIVVFELVTLPLPPEWNL